MHLTERRNLSFKSELCIGKTLMSFAMMVYVAVVVVYLGFDIDFALHIYVFNNISEDISMISNLKETVSTLLIARVDYFKVFTQILIKYFGNIRCIV